MMRRAIAVLPALMLVAALAPTMAGAGAAPASYDLNTRQTDVMSAGEYDGRLKMRISADGIVSGTFWDTEGHVSSVSGGLDGTKLWIDIGNASPTGRRLFNGTLVDGKLTATAVAATRGLHTWVLEGTPATH
jgi:hypothetical protein